MWPNRAPQRLPGSAFCLAFKATLTKTILNFNFGLIIKGRFNLIFADTQCSPLRERRFSCSAEQRDKQLRSYSLFCFEMDHLVYEKVKYTKRNILNDLATISFFSYSFNKTEIVKC